MTTISRETRIETAREELSTHLSKHQNLRYTFSVALNNLSLVPQIWQPYHAFLKYAHAVSTSEVRVFDIMTWHKGVDQATTITISRLQDYYHKEARLLYKLKKLTGTVPEAVRRDLAELRGDHGTAASMTFSPAIGMDVWRWEDTYAIAFDEYSPRFGYEIYTPGLGAVDLRFTGGGPSEALFLVAEIVANFEVRIIRLQHTDREERYGARVWSESVESRVLDWIKEARKFVPERYGELRTRMQSWVVWLEKWKKEIYKLMVLRVQKQQMGDVDHREPGEAWKSEMRDTRRQIRDELRRLVSIYGPRATWDWEQ